MIEDLLVAHPELAAVMTELAEEWAPEEPSLCHALAAVVHWIDAAAQEGMLDFSRIGAIVEQVLVTADPSTRDIVSTCFVEALANRSDRLPARAYESALGPTARQIAREWLAF